MSRWGMMAAAAFACALLATRDAQAGDYGDFGTIEIGGSFSAASTTADFGDTGGKTTTLAGTLQPFAGLFVLPACQVFATAEIGYSQVTPDGGDSITSQVMGGGIGGALLLGFGRARVGPALSVRYVQETLTPEGEEAIHVRSGPGAEAAAMAKLQIGGGGIVTVSVFASHDILEDETDNFSRTAIGTRGAFSIFF